ncbi:MAG TPA: hypothetical protein VMT68_00530 [Caulobacteraceae bacterium]|nr:hypothetical protein [Caulobacteraceae bacterium]
MVATVDRGAQLRLMRSDRLFYASMSAIVVGLVFVGFARSWFLSAWFAPPPGTPRIGPLLVFHGVIFSTWAALLLTQPLLISARNVRLHRRLGYAGAGLAALMWIVGNLAAIAAIHVGFIGMGDPYAAYILPFVDLQVFAVCTALAVALRRSPEAHKRLILLGSTQIAEPALARLPLAGWSDTLPAGSLVGCDFVILAGVVYDFATRGRVHPVWVFGGAAVVASEVIRLAINHTGPWLAFARFMASLYAG